MKPVSEQSREPRRFHPLWIVLPVLAALSVSALLSLPAVYFGKVYFRDMQAREARSAAPVVAGATTHTADASGRN